MNRIWIKLYLELLDDVKLVGLPEAVCWRFVQLLMVAGERDEGGILPPTKQLAWRLRMDQAQLLDDLRVLSEVGVVVRQGEHWKVTNFEKRQAAMTEAERAGRYRARQRSSPGAAAVTSSDAAAVTDSYSSSPPPGGEGAGGGGADKSDGRDDDKTFKAVPPPPGYGEYLEEMRASRREKARRAAGRSQDEPNSSDGPGQGSGPQPP